MSLINLLKNLPVDLGQGSKRFITKGKLIALSYIEKNGNGKIILDVGCREGAQSHFFQTLGYSVVSIDIEKIYEKCQVVDCNKKLPFDDQSFDIIWSSEVLEHLIDPEYSVQELKRVLKPGGKIVLTTPNSFAVYFCIFAAIGLTPQKIQRSDHLHFFDLSQLRRIFPKATFSGYLPFTFIRPEIKNFIGYLSPTFIIIETK